MQTMQINILIPHRPCSGGGLSTSLAPLHQKDDGTWVGWEELKPREHGEEIYRCIRTLNKNSYYKHKIKVMIDSDVYPNENWLKEFDNVEVLKSNYVCNVRDAPLYRVNDVDIIGINSVPDEEWICYSYISDLLCPKDWDKLIIDAIEKYGDNYVYVPMFVEIKGPVGDTSSPKGIRPTNTLIWDLWRNTICCHALYMPEPAGGGFTWKDIYDYIEVATEVDRGIIFEPPGARIYGYYGVMFMKAKYAKKAIRFIGPGFDIDMDSRLGEMGLTKAVITNSFVFHPFCQFMEEEKHEM